MRRWVTPTAVLTVVALLVVAAPAAAQAVPGVTLKASRNVLEFGEATRLFGSIEPAQPNQEVQIVDETGDVVATAATDAEGRYSVRYKPRTNQILHARWLAAISEPVRIGVRPKLTVTVERVFLFARAPVSGRVQPAHSDETVTVKLLRAGKTVATKKVGIDRKGRFRTRVAIRRPGAYRVKVSFDDDDHLAARDRTGRRSTPLPYLNVGDRGSYVRLLERRLVELGYHLTGIDELYDARTRDAIIAFHKIQRTVRSGEVGTSTWTALASPKRPQPRYEGPRRHVEIDQTRQVVMLVRNGEVRWIIHSSTGAGGATRDGRFTIFREISGTSGGGLYYPTYFDGLRAIHGWPEVPTYPASHGCARIPMWAAEWVHDQNPIGTRVYVYH